MTHRPIRWPWLGGILVLAVGCGGSEADNPGVGGPPEPDSPIDFEVEPPGCPVDTRDSPPREMSLWANDGQLLVGWADGLVIIDVRDPGVPRLLSRTALAGEPRQVLLEENAVTLVLDQWPAYTELQQLPDSPLAPATHLMRFDIAAPEAPARVADIVIADEFWRLIPQPGGYWLMGARRRPNTQNCTSGPDNCDASDREAIILDHYSFSDFALIRGEHAELPYGDRAMSAPGGFATTAQGQLHVAMFDGTGGLLPARAITVDSPIPEGTAIDIRSDRITFFAPDLTVVDSSGELLGSVPGLRSAGARTHFTDKGVFIAGPDLRAPGSFVDLSNLPEIQVLTLDRISEVLPIERGSSAPRRALGWYQEAGNLRFSLLSLETSSPSVLDAADAIYDASGSDGGLWLGSARGFFRANGEFGTILGTIDWNNDSLSVQAPIANGYVTDAFDIEGFGYVLASGGLSVRPFNGDANSKLELEGATVVDIASRGDFDATLFAGATGDRWLEIQHEGLTDIIPFSPLADRVLPAGDRWLVLETGTPQQCEAARPDCPGIRPQVSIIGGAPSQLLATVALPPPAPRGQSASISEQWLSSDEHGSRIPVAIPGDRWILVRHAHFAAGALRSFFILDASTASLRDPVDIEAVGETFWSGGLRLGAASSGNTLMALRIEPLPDNDPGSARRARFLLDRLELSSDGALARGATNVVPGYPIALLDSETLLSAQPGPEQSGSATLVRSRLQGVRVNTEGTRRLDPRYAGLVVVDDYVLHLRRQVDACEQAIILDTFRLATPFTQVGSLELPAHFGFVVDAVGSDAILADVERRAFVRVHVAGDGSPSVAGFTMVPAGLSRAHWRGGFLQGIADGRRVRLPL